MYYSNGNVGIGTNNPNQKLEVAGNVSSTNFCLGGTCISSWSSGLNGGGTLNYVGKFTGSGTIGNSLLFDNGTNVGIGTASPGAGYKLDVNGTVNATGLSINGTAVGGAGFKPTGSVFLTSGTSWTVPAGTTWIQFALTGAGGGGGSGMSDCSGYAGLPGMTISGWYNVSGFSTISYSIGAGGSGGGGGGGGGQSTLGTSPQVAAGGGHAGGSECVAYGGGGAGGATSVSYNATTTITGIYTSLSTSYGAGGGVGAVGKPGLLEIVY